MPLPTDPEVLQTAKGLVSAQKAAAGGPHPGLRPAHARGLLLTGTFTPTTTASALTTAPHFSASSTPITIRFSSSTGIPTIPDTDPNANPRGIAIRFHLGGRTHTDVIAHSTPFFPTRTGEEFLAFLQAAGASAGATTHPTPVEQFLASHPAAVSFLTAEKPSPVSFATESFWSVNALKFVDSAGKERYFRYRVIPVLGVQTLDAEAVAKKSKDYLYDEVKERVGTGAVEFKLLAQLAGEGDVVDDATVLWPEEREVVELGTVSLEKVVEEGEQAGEQKRIIFDPIPRVEGIETSKDPLLEMRAAVYLISGKERRAA
ncbi:catalase related subgroup [Lepidopterella palustris CBS 459.81]|uniref:Catalase related subgroup n=1 Tax=Lepidopterella palustris CBS 459.81 TaxID=1314670 RepID=A0A8E2J8S4_9PEZI|nr:catalase related subgroup [Lepidopterella palustris CBS 459.81]